MIYLCANDNASKPAETKLSIFRNIKSRHVYATLLGLVCLLSAIYFLTYITGLLFNWA